MYRQKNQHVVTPTVQVNIVFFCPDVGSATHEASADESTLELSAQAAIQVTPKGRYHSSFSSVVHCGENVHHSYIG